MVTQPTEETITNGIIRVTGADEEGRLLHRGPRRGRASQDQQDPKGFAEREARARAGELRGEDRSLLPSVEKIPDDASVVVLAGPDAPAHRRTRSRALDGVPEARRPPPRAGRPAQRRRASSRRFLADWGVKLGNDIVIDREVRLFEGPRLGVVPISQAPTARIPITQDFRDFTVYPQTRTRRARRRRARRASGHVAGEDERRRAGPRPTSTASSPRAPPSLDDERPQGARLASPSRSRPS